MPVGSLRAKEDMKQGDLPRACVAALTYCRPEALPALLGGMLRLEHPAGWDIQFLIVDNDPNASARAVVNQTQRDFPWTLHYVNERTVGIPFARNRALSEARKRGARLLCFLDDDDVPSQYWLTELVSRWEATKAVLMGGPHRKLVPNVPLSFAQRLIGRSLVARRSLMERRNSQLGKKGRVRMIGTGNWMADLEWMASHNVEFDPAYRDSGGEDAAFLLETRRLGGAVAWAPDAIVWESIDPKRLTIPYQFHRSYCQGIVGHRLNPRSRLMAIAAGLPQALIGAGLALVPIFGIASFTAGLHLTASALGRMAGAFGRTATIYSACSAQSAD